MDDRARIVGNIKASPHDAYWALRYCETVNAAGLNTPEEERLYAKSLACVASTDPHFIIEESHLGVAQRLGLYSASMKAVAAVEERIRIADDSLAAYVKGKLWIAAMALRTKKGAARSLLGDCAKRAVLHLQQVGEQNHSPDYYEVLCRALAHADYRALLANFDNHYRTAPSYLRCTALILVLDAAARHRDWKTYDAYRIVYRQLPHDTVRAHDDCTVLNLDGLRALASRDIAGARTAIRQLLRCGKNVAFLGTPDTVSLPKLLAKRGLLLDECRAYMRLVLGGREEMPVEFGPALCRIFKKPSTNPKRVRGSRSPKPTARRGVTK